MYKCIVVTIAAFFAFAIGRANAAGFSSVEERMSQSEFHAAGLDKLSPDELKAIVHDYDGIAARSSARITAPIMDAALPRLKVGGRRSTPTKSAGSNSRPRS